MTHERLGELLRGVMRRYNLERRARQHAAINLWPEVVGAGIARNCWPLGVRDGVLLVGAVNHAWAQTLHLMRPAITEALNARVGEEVVREINVCVVDRAQRPEAGGGARRPRPTEPAEPPPLTCRQQQLVRELTARIEDPPLQAKVRGALTALLRLQRLRESQPQRACARCGGPLAGRGKWCAACAARR